MAEISRPTVDVGRPAWSTTRWSNISQVDPALRDTLERAAQEFARQNPGYTVQGFSGKRSRTSGTKHHPAGHAIDVNIIGPDNKPLANRKNAQTFRTYEKFAQIARQVQQAFHPELKDKFGWGGYFQQGVSFDQMHFDIDRVRDKKGRQNTAYGQWETGLNKAGRRALPGAESQGINAFPPAPPGPTAPETGPGMYGAMSATDLAQSYAAAGNRRAYEQGVGPATAATPIDTFNAQSPLPSMTTAIPTSRQSQTIGNMLSGMDSPVYGPGDIAPASNIAGIGGRVGGGAVAPAAIDPARFGGMPSMAGPDFGSVAGRPSAIAGGDVPGLGWGAPMAPGGTAPMGGIFGAGTQTPSLTPPAMADRPMPGSLSQSGLPGTMPNSMPNVNAPMLRPDLMNAVKTTPMQNPLSRVDDALNPALGNIALTPGLVGEPYATAAVPTTAPAPAFTKPPTEVPTQKVAAAQPVREQVVKTRTVAPAPTIAPAAPPPAKPGGLIGSLENLVTGPLGKFALTAALGPAGMLATLPFSKTLQNLAGPVPNPPTRNIGTGSAAISGVLSGQAEAGDTAYSRSMPGYSVKDLGNGMVEKTNQYGVKSYEHVDKPGGIFSSKPGGLYSSNPSGLLSGFGLSGVPSTVGGMFSPRNLGTFAGGLIGGLPGAVAGGFLGNLVSGGGTGFGNTANVGPNAMGYAGPWGSGTAPAASGGGLFGGFGGGFGGFGGFGGGGGTSSAVGGKKDSGKSGGGGSTGQSHSTRF